MVQLLDREVSAREILDWRGVHIFHAPMSSCSQKLRIFLNLKGIEWQGHVVDLAAGDNYSSWFLGINPRGLVPVLVWDGAVHIESNDIIALLEERFPDPCLIPREHQNDVSQLLRHEDDLHLDLRCLSFRFVVNRTSSNKTVEMMTRYRDNEDRTVAGRPDRAQQGKEIAFYERLEANGLPDDVVRAAAAKFHREFESLEARLSKARDFLGDTLSVLDIAWYVYVRRLDYAGYPFGRLHPRLHAWRQAFDEDARFDREVTLPDAIRSGWEKNRAEQAQNGTSFIDVTGM